jgi:hypothetical protein
MPSVFAGAGGKSQALNGVIRAEDVLLTFPGNTAGSEGSLVQQAELTCERTVNMIYEIGSPKVYYVGDRRRGTARFSRVVGGSATFKNMIQQFGDICKASQNDIDLKVGSGQCGGTKGTITYKMIASTLNSLGASVTANDIVVTENMGFMFVDLEYEAT